VSTAHNLDLCRRVSDAVNDRRDDDMDALFAPDFVDHNPAERWVQADTAGLMRQVGVTLPQ
jgi:hypothetical protein